MFNQIERSRTWQKVPAYATPIPMRRSTDSRQRLLVATAAYEGSEFGWAWGGAYRPEHIVKVVRNWSTSHEVLPVVYATSCVS